MATLVIKVHEPAPVAINVTEENFLVRIENVLSPLVVKELQVGPQGPSGYQFPIHVSEDLPSGVPVDGELWFQV